MSKFDTTKNKLQKLWEEVVSNTSEVSSKSNIDQFSFFNNLLKQQNIKTPIEIYNSDDIFLVPELINNVQTALKSEQMPTLISYSQLIDFEIPEQFLPFVKYSVEIQSVPDTEIHGVYEYDPSDWAGDYIVIKGDGKLIFTYDINNITGVPSTIGASGGSQTFPLSYFTENNINLDLTKRVWFAKIVKTNDDVINGNVTELNNTVLLSEGTGNCTGQYNRETFDVDPLNNPGHKIINLTSTSYTAIGDFTVHTLTDSGGTCHDGDVITNNIQKTFSFSSLDNYSIRVHSSGFAIEKDEIQTQSFEETGRWLFWSNLLQKLFVLLIDDEKDGDKFEVEMVNLPIEDTGDPSSDILPYTAMTLQRNLETVTSLPEIQKLSESFSHINQNGINVKSIETSNRQFKNYVKTSESSASIPKYRFKLNGSFIITSSSIIPNFIIRTNTDIDSQEFQSIGINEWNAMINEDESDYLSGIVQNIYHKKSRLAGSIITEFFTDPINNPNHAILSLTSTTFTAIGDETVTIFPPGGEPIITKRNNIIVIDESFSDYDDYTVTYSLSILDTTDFPVYDDIYTQVESPSFPGVFSYQLTTEDHELLSKDVWLPDTQDITLNIKAYLINPLYWREQRKYKK